MLIILTGKTASGKDTIRSAIFKKFPNLKKIITVTSRSPRYNDVRGIDYHFLARDEFETRAKKGDFAEYVEYGGNLYGTLKKDLESALKHDTLWKIDPSRAGEVRNFIKRSFSAEVASELIKRVLVIYISTPDDVILERLKKRGLSETEIQKRMSDDRKIWNQYNESYDFVIDNVPGKLDETINRVITIIENHQSPFAIPKLKY